MFVEIFYIYSIDSDALSNIGFQFDGDMVTIVNTVSSVKDQLLHVRNIVCLVALVRKVHTFSPWIPESACREYPSATVYWKRRIQTNLGAPRYTKTWWRD